MPGPWPKDAQACRQVRRTGADSCIAGFWFLMLHLSWIPSLIHVWTGCLKFFPELKEVLDHSVKMVSYSVNSAPKIDTAELTSVCTFLAFDFYGFLSWGWVFFKAVCAITGSPCSSFVCVPVCFLVFFSGYLLGSIPDSLSLVTS